MKVWRLITHHADPGGALDWCWRNRRIAIGWGQIGNIDVEGYNSASEIADAITQHYPNDAGSGGGPSLWNFYKKMQKDDLVILSTGRPESSWSK